MSTVHTEQASFRGRSIRAAACCLLFLWAGSLRPPAASAFDPAEYEEPGGLGFTLFRQPDGAVYGGGFESGVWWKGTPIFGELFGYWLTNNLLEGQYYSIGMTVRLMPRWRTAPFAGAGGSYNRLTSGRVDLDREDDAPPQAYWQGHAEAGARIWFGPRQEQFLESAYRRHWAETGGGDDPAWVAVKYGRLF